MAARIPTLIVGAAVAWAWLQAASVARADEVDQLAQRVVELESRVRDLDGQLTPKQAVAADAAARRLIDGQVLYELKKYENAATIFLDIVQRFPSSAEYPEALFYLADALYLKRDFISSRRYYEKSVELGERGRHYQEALERLIEVSLHLRDYAPVDSYLEKLGRLEGGASSGSTVPYVKGKYYFFRKRYDEAKAALKALPAGHKYWFQGQYFIGASLVVQGFFGEAVEVFDALIKAKPPGRDLSETEKRVVELGHLALGRLYYDQGQLPAATNEYAKIPQTSDVFVDALYEGAWVAIKEKLYQKAYRSLDLFLTMQPEGPQVPEVKLLMGNLQIRQGEWDAATASFTRTRDQFDGVKKDMETTLSRQGNSATFFQNLLTKNLGKFDLDAALPASAVKWVQKDPDVEQVTALFGDLGDVGRVIEESDQLIARLERALDGPQRVNIFPELAMARTRSLETSNQLIEIENQLLKIERLLVVPVIQEGERQELDRLNKERERIERVLGSLPKEKDSYQERMRKLREAFDERDKRAVELNVLVQSYRAERVALEKYFYASGRDKDPAKKALFEEAMADLKRTEDELVGAQDKLRTDIQESLRSVGVDDVQMQEEERQKRELYGVMMRERELFANVRARLDSNARVKADQIESVLGRARGAAETVAGFNKRIDAIVDERAGEFKRVVLEEKANFVAYRQRLTTENGTASEVGGVLLAESFRKIAERFYQVVVRADVGIIDVAWALKQARTDENSRLVREKKRELKLLDDEFREVLKE